MREPLFKRFSGGGTVWLIAVAIALMMPISSLAEEVRIGFLGLENDPRYDADLVYARIQIRPQGDPLEGAMLAVDDMKIVADAVDLEIGVDARKAANVDELNRAAKDMIASGIVFILVDLPASHLRPLTEAIAGETVTLINVSAPDMDLRTACYPILLHTASSDRMIADAFTQYLRLRNWTRILLLSGQESRDTAFAAAFRQSAERLRLTIVSERTFDLSTSPEAREQNNVQLLTSGVGNYDLVFIADADGEFSRYVSYQTSLPRPVIGNTGLSALEWHWSLERYGAPQVNSRFETSSMEQRRMGWQDWSAWVAMRAVITAYAKSGSLTFADVDGFLRSARLRLDGSKGVSMSFRPWSGQLRQPILLATDNATIAIAPLEGFLHQTNTLDTLGIDEREFACD